MAIGSRIGPRIGVGIGPGPRGGSAMSSVALDAIRNVYAPASLAEWQTALGVAGIASHDPTNLWLGQEAAGNLADSIGTAPLTAANAPSYQTAVPGWSRKAVSWVDGSSSRFSNFVNIPALNVTNAFLLGYVYTSNVPGVERHLCGMGNATAFWIDVTTGQKYQVTNPAGTTADGIVNYGGSVRPICLSYNTTQNTLKIYTDSEIVTDVYGGVTGGGVWWGGQLNPTPTGGLLYSTLWVGNTAGNFTDAQVRTLLQTLNWSIAW